MKTILIPILQGVEARNILRTDIFRVLRAAPGIGIVLLVPHQQKLEYYRKEFFGPNINYEVFENYRSNWLDRWFGNLKIYLLRTVTMDIKRKIRLEDEGNYFLYALSWIGNRIFSRKFFRKIFRFADHFLIHNRQIVEMLDRHQPSLVFAAHPFSDLEAALLREAKRRGIRTIGIINSWDKFTARNIIRVLPDKLVVHNEIIKKEALDYGDFPEKDIEISGVPHFDYYTKPPRVSRKELFKKMGFDFEKKVVLFSPVGKSFSDVDWELIQIMDELVKTGKIIFPVQFLVRFPPNDVVDLGPLSDKPNFIFETPGVRFSKDRGIDWDMTTEELLHLRDEFAHINLLITHVSTLAIEAAIADKPIIAIDFDGKKKRLLSQSATRLLRFTHFQPMLRSGGVRVVKNEEELAGAINDYLKKPTLDCSGRKQIVHDQCWKIDGLAGQRVGKFILNQL